MFEKYPALEKYLVINRGYISSDQHFDFSKVPETSFLDVSDFVRNVSDVLKI